MNSTTLGLPRSAGLSSDCIHRAGAWFLGSGIQEPPGGVARYHYIAERRNARVSTEITGYTVSALVELFEREGVAAYRAAAIRAADLLCRAWDAAAQAMPFEWAEDGVLPEHHSYFFDNGIIVRGLLRLWRHVPDERYRTVALACGESMLRDFVNANDIDPILELPSKQPLPRDARWSRSSDCYQLKSALGWLDLAAVTGEARFEQAFETVLARGLRTHERFFEHEPAPARVMDRLHAYGYFLEALLARSARPEARQALSRGIDCAAANLRRVHDGFERSDVCGQLLRVRLWADAAGAVPLDQARASEEAAWASAHQMKDPDPRLDGGFNFGRRDGRPSNFSNPVSTAFCLQGLALWNDYCHGAPLTAWHTLI